MDGDALNRPKGLAGRMAAAWRRPRASVRAELALADEGRLLFFAFAGSVFYSLGRVGALWTGGEARADFTEAAATQLVVGTFFRPLALYLAAALIGLICRALGGSGDWRATRAALFWSGLAVAPAGALAMVAGAGTAASTTLGDAIGSVLWAVLLAPMLAEAHGFRVGVVAAVLAIAAVMVGGLIVAN